MREELTALIELHFNTKKVRLKPVDISASAFQKTHFNTKKVRLKLGAGRINDLLVIQFQYQKGAIKTQEKQATP